MDKLGIDAPDRGNGAELNGAAGDGMHRDDDAHRNGSNGHRLQLDR